MKTITLSDPATDELRRVLTLPPLLSNKVFDDLRKALTAPPPPYVSEQDQIIAGILYQPPAGGWPKPSNDQEKPGPNDTSRIWLAIGSKGQGYYIDNKPTPADPGSVAPWPYTGVGLDVVFAGIGGASQEFRSAAEQRGMQIAGSQAKWNLYFAANYNADPYWNASVGRVYAGDSPDQVIADLQAEGAKFAFNAGQLAAAKIYADSL